MATTLQSTTNSVTASFQNFYQILINFLPSLIAAIVIFIIGWIIASALGSAVTSIVRTIHVDRLAERFGLTQMGQRIGRPISISGVLGWLVKWFILVITFVAAANALNLQQVSNFLYTQAIPYFGNVVLAAIILIIGILAANFLYEIVRDALKASRFSAADTVASISRWAILIFSGIAALSQLKIATFFMQYLFVAIVFMIALAGGLAFGLGGRDQARDLLGSMRKPKQP